MENETLKAHYLLLLRQMCPTLSADRPDNEKLVILRQRIARLVEMLTVFEHSWAEEVPVLQRACLSQLALDTLPRKERQQLIDAWANWSDFHYKLAHYRGLLIRFVQYHQRIGEQLDSLLTAADGETAPGSPEINQEGGK